MMEIAVKAAKEAGNILLDNLGKIKKIETKRQNNILSLVTNVDIKAEEKICQIIREAYPEHDILSEERVKVSKNSDYKWIIDPLDGTHNYIRGIPFFGICIALAYQEDVLLGVIHLPLFNEMFKAEKGEGAYLNKEKIKVSRRALKESALVYDSDLHLSRAIMLDSLNRLAGRVFNVRMFGSSAQNLSFLARGCVDLVIEYHDSPWDFSAGALLVEEAGGKVTDFEGDKWKPEIGKYIASNGKIHDEVLKILKPEIQD
ncbi:MAG: inositol monophosphatase [Candidatus Aerophobetes bacterium]|nr:inositol monophosphatase [Candidatus Aerophobetes bacterium]